MDKLKNRHIRIISYLLNLQYPVSAFRISEETGISQSTLKKDLNTISMFLRSKNLILVRKPRIGISLQGNENDKYNVKIELTSLYKNTTLTKEERVMELILDCLTSDKIPTIDDWCDKFGTSRTTIADDVKYVKVWLKENNLNLERRSGVGYRLDGNEEKIRNAIVKLILKRSEEQYEKLIEWLFDKKIDKINLSFLERALETELFPVRQFLDKIELQANIKLADRDFLVFVLKIATAIKRIKNKHYLTMDTKTLSSVMRNPVYKVIYSNISSLEEVYNIKFSYDEIAYITLNLISSELQEDSFLINENNEKFRLYAQKISEITNDVFGIPILNDEESIHLLELHLKAALNKIRYGFEIENPLLEEIKEEYPLSFHIAKSVASILGKKMRMKIPENEIGYIALYIAMAMEKIEYQKKKRKKVAVICAMANGTSGLLYWRMLNEMPDIDVVQVGSYKDIVEEKIDPNIDLIVSTIPLPKTKIPHIVVSPFLSNAERKAIREMLGITKFSLKSLSSIEIKEFLDSNIIFANLKLEKAKDVIEFLGEALVKHGYAKNGFTTAILEREKKFPTGLDTPVPIAIPHLDTSFTLKSGFAFATLEKPVLFSQMGEPNKKVEVRIVLMPTLTQKNEDNVIFYDLLRKFRDVKTAYKLLTCRNVEEIKKVLTENF